MMDPPDDTSTKSGVPAITKGSTHRTRRLAIISALTLLIVVGPVPVGAQVTDTRSEPTNSHATLRYAKGGSAESVFTPASGQDIVTAFNVRRRSA